jgi:hypothetical protein
MQNEVQNATAGKERIRSKSLIRLVAEARLELATFGL